MSEMLLAILTACMFVVALVFSMLGQGGGVLYTPIQVWSGIDFHVAATTSLFLIMTTSLSATIVFRKAKRVDWPLAIVLETVTAVGGLIGGLTSGRFSGPFLMVVFAAVIAFAAIFMVRDFQWDHECAPRSSFLSWRRRLGDREYCVNLAVALPISFLAGAISGLVGVGGGILKVPMMVLLLGIPMEVAVGSSAFMIGLTAAGGFAGHVASGHWDWRVSLILAVAVFAGGQIGARLSLGLDRKRMKRGFGWFLFVIAIVMCVKAALR
ncbi:MAG: sulfite exporter TauE/SafE family protein [Planctomycetota bacterium]|nr:MAG: sulfite exporter TauE/SafE family protein [Planctomycetota bacterium]